MYIRYCYKEEQVKISRRSDNEKSGHLLISVPASRVAKVDAALAFLEAKRQQRGVSWSQPARTAITPCCVRTATLDPVLVPSPPAFGAGLARL
jgi:hypothetical protein